MTTKRSRRVAAHEAAKAEANRRYPDRSGKSTSLRIGFVAGAMWHREKHGGASESASGED